MSAVMKPQAPAAEDTPPQRVARALGWFSIGLGVAELVAPNAVARACGMKPNAALVRLYGLREIAVGIGLLRSRNAAPWLWSRVGGDALDLATLAVSANRPEAPGGKRVAIAALNLAAVTAVDAYTAQVYKKKPARAGIDFPDYGWRTGFPKPPALMRGAALADFTMPEDMATPKLLRPWDQQEREPANDAQAALPAPATSAKAGNGPPDPIPGG